MMAVEHDPVRLLTVLDQKVADVLTSDHGSGPPPEVSGSGERWPYERPAELLAGRRAAPGGARPVGCDFPGAGCLGPNRERLQGRPTDQRPRRSHGDARKRPISASRRTAPPWLVSATDFLLRRISS
jgi:hypothetical protein